MSWVSVENADTYFAENKISDYYTSFDNLDDIDKTKALAQSQFEIENSSLFVFTDAEISNPTDAMVSAVCEHALWLLDNKDAVKRRSLIMQGVKSAGIFKETYKGDGAGILISEPASSILIDAGNGTFSGVSSVDWSI